MPEPTTDDLLTHAKSRYPFWDDVLDGRPWRLVRGVDYHASDAAMRSACYAAAKRAGVRVTVQWCEDGLRVQAYVEG